MRIWTYLRPFSFREEAYTVEVFFTFAHTVSRLFLGDRLLDEQSVHHMNGIQVLVHSLTSADGEQAKIEVGYCLLYTSPSPRDRQKSRMPSSA